MRIVAELLNEKELEHNRLEWLLELEEDRIQSLRKLEHNHR